MRRLEHCNIVKLKYFFYSSGDKVSASCQHPSDGAKRESAKSGRLPITTFGHSHFELYPFSICSCCVISYFRVATNCLTRTQFNHYNISVFFHAYGTQQKDEVYLNLVLEYIPETVYKVARQYAKSKQTIPINFIRVSAYIYIEIIIIIMKNNNSFATVGAM